MYPYKRNANFWRAPVLVTVCLILTSVAAGQTKPLPLDSILATRTFGDRTPLALSPDNQLVAYTVLDPSRRTDSGEDFTPTGVPMGSASSDIWLSGLHEGKSRSLTQSKGSSWDPVWSPDGRRLAFYSDRDGMARLWVWERATDQLRRVSSEIVRADFGFEVIRWTSDSKRILVKLIPEHMSYEELAALTSERTSDARKESQKEVPSVIVYQSPLKQGKQEAVAGWTNSNLSDLVAVDVESGVARRLVKRSRIRGVWLSPDNRYVALTIFKEIKPGTQIPLFDVAWASLDSGEPHVLASNADM